MGCNFTKFLLSLSGGKLQTIQSKAIISQKPTKIPIIGEKSRESIIFLMPIHCSEEKPIWATDAPISPPIKACVDDDGIAKHQVIMHQIMAPLVPARIVT